jgi:hypothetical protein
MNVAGEPFLLLIFVMALLRKLKQIVLPEPATERTIIGPSLRAISNYASPKKVSTIASNQKRSWLQIWTHQNNK